MKQKIFILFGMLIFAFLLFSCSSPMDNVSPLDKKYIGKTDKVKLKISNLTFEENGIVKDLLIKHSEIIVDTTTNPYSIWMSLQVESNSQYNDYRSDNLRLGALEIKLDSIQILGKPHIFDAVSNNSWVKFNLIRGLNKELDTTTYAGNQRNISEILFSLNNEIISGSTGKYVKKELWANFRSNIYDFRVWNEIRDTVVKDTSYITKYDTTWAGNKMIINERIEPVIKEIKIRIEEEKRVQDSLFINTKFKLVF